MRSLATLCVLARSPLTIFLWVAVPEVLGARFLATDGLPLAPADPEAIRHPCTDYWRRLQNRSVPEDDWQL
jgi:hypothetical protein